MKRNLSIAERIFLLEYKLKNWQLLKEDADFAKWVSEDYRPLAGRWQY
jgi:hypothetical protein